MRRDRAVFRLAVAVAAAPIVIAAVHNGLVGWYPARDTAITVIRARDVFSGQPPLMGLPAFTSTESGLVYNYLGAPMMYVLAIPLRVLGTSWGVLLTTAVTNTAWFVTAMWLLRRRVGYRAGLLACVFAATLLWGIGSQVLVDPTPVQGGVVASLTLMVAAWSVAERDPKGIIPLAFAANFTVLNHLQFMVVTPFVVGAAIVLAYWRGRRTSRGGVERADAMSRAGRRPLIGATIVTFVFWLPPLIDQFFFPSANLSRLLRAVSSMTEAEAARSSVHRDFIDVVGVVSSPITSWPLWFRDSFAEPNFWVFGPTLGFTAGAIGLVVVVASTVFVMITAARRGDRALVTGPLLVFVAWIGWIISGLSSATAQGWKLKYFHALWPLSMLLWFLIVLGLLRWFRGLASTRRLLDRHWVTTAGSMAAVAVVFVFSALTIPRADLGAGTPLRDVPIARQIHRDVTDRVTSDVPILAHSDTVTRPYMPVVLATLQEKGIEFRFDSNWDVRIYGASRAHRPEREPRTASIAVRTVPDFSAGSRFVSATGPELELSFERYFAVGSALTSWAETVEELALPDETTVPEEFRAQADRELAEILAEVRAEQADLLSDPKFLGTAVLLADSGFLETLEAPDVSIDELTAWLSDQRTVIESRDDRNTFVFVTYRPASSS